MKARQETLKGKVKVKNPRYFKLTQWLDYLPDAFTLWFADKFYYFYFPYLVVEVEIDIELWFEGRPFGSTNALELCGDTSDTRLFISDEDYYIRKPLDTATMVWLFGKDKYLDIFKKVFEMAYSKGAMI